MQYIFFLVYLFIKIVFSSFCFFTYGYFIDAKLTWRNAVQIALVGEIVFVIQMFMKVIYFTFVVPEKLDDISGYTAMSLKYFFSSGVPQFFNYLFLTVNVYELIYILLVARLISKETSNNYINGVIFVLKSYGIGMILWMLVITFLLIQIV
ncbi:MAG: hypothetical protein K2Q21_03990 [Chitinophagaceae bacterium]|nr:hypothetical protein [Chitinophagaceae bacterium]